jgi:L-fuconolactonase
MRVLDAHQHFWKIGGPGQSWPDADRVQTALDLAAPSSEDARTDLFERVAAAFYGIGA